VTPIYFINLAIEGNEETPNLRLPREAAESAALVRGMGVPAQSHKSNLGVLRISELLPFSHGGASQFANLRRCAPALL